VPVDGNKTIKVLVVHGVQVGDNASLEQDKELEELIHSRLNGIAIDFDVDLYRYENLNDKKTRGLRTLAKLLMKTSPATVVVDKALDLALDVVINLEGGSTAAAIRNGLKDKILEYYTSGHPCFVVAHSLGSIYAFDVVCELMRDRQFYDRNAWDTWPVQGLLTLGSPIGLKLFRVRGRTTVPNLGPGMEWFRWLNYWDRTDPVVSGQIFGQPLKNYHIAERYLRNNTKQGWFIRDHIVDTGKTWLLSHTAYWSNAMVGDGLVNLMMS